MRFGMELKKLRRTGYFPAFPAGAAAASAFPILNMAVRTEVYTGLPGNPLDILLDASWQMMAMLNILLIVCCTCMMYHTEYAENGIQKMEVLPVRQISLFLRKFLITTAMAALVIMIELAALAFCILMWFPDAGIDLKEFLCHWSFEVILLLPTIMVSLIIASACRNMWIPLGIGVILVFTFSVLPKDYLFLDLCPYCSPYQLLTAAEENGHAALFLGVCIGETALAGMAEHIYLKIRRYFS